MSLEPTVSGVLVSFVFAQDKITLSHKGESLPDSTHNVKGAAYYLNGKQCFLVDMLPGDLIVVRGEPAKRVDATR